MNVTMRLFPLYLALKLSLLLQFGASLDEPEPTTSKLQIRIPQSLSKPDGYDHRDALFGIPPYGGTIQQQVFYADSTLCAANADTSIGYPERPVKNGKMEPWDPPFILMVDRGDCTFVQKVRTAQRSGAAAVLIADNTCLCTFPQCVPDDPGESCELQEPIMADDGSGSDISIPSFLLFKQDADPIINALKQNQHVRVEMSFSMPAPDARVEYELWTIPTDEVARPIERDFKEAAVALGTAAYFTPHFYIYDGMRAGCDQEGVDECYNLCTNAGRYCAIDPDDDLDAGISGADIVAESLRRICIWQTYGTKDGVGKEYWNYLNEFIFRCGDAQKADLFRDKACIADAMTHAGVTKKTIDSCISDSGGLEGDVANKYLDAELAAKDAAGVVLIPTLNVNKAPVRGQLSLSTALKAICAGYLSGSAPHVCVQCAACLDETECVKSGTCKAGFSTVSSGVSTPLFAVTLFVIVAFFGIIVFIQHKRQQTQMREQVRGILAQYMPLDENKAAHADNSVGFTDTDSEFTIT